MPESNFSFYRPPVTRVNYCKEATLVGIYKFISNPKYAKQVTDELRRIEDKEKRADFKKENFSYCTFSGSFGFNRKDNGLEEHSELIGFDFDYVENVNQVKQLLLNDPKFETLLLFTSPSGNGVKWVIHIDLAKATHEQWFNAVSYYLQKTYQLQADPACRNVARACFLPYDPEAYIAPRLLPELQPLTAENPAVLGLMNSLCATQITVEKNGE